MRRRYKTKVHSEVSFNSRWGEPRTRALCSAQSAERTAEPDKVTCEICLRYLTKFETFHGFATG